HPPQVVHDVSAGYDEYPAFAQGSELRTQFEVIVERLVGVDAQLHDRDRRVRECVNQNRPRAMVDAPTVDVFADPGRVDGVADLRGEFGQAGGRVLDIE